MDEEAALADYRAVAAPESLQRFADRHDLSSFPFYVCIRKKGLHWKSSKRLVYVHEKKLIPFASCVSDKHQSAYTIPVGKESGLRLLPAARPSNPACILPSELLSCKTPPSIVFVSKSFMASAKGKSADTVSLNEGILLFLQEIKNKKKATVSLSAMTEKGLEVTIGLRCTGRFSVSFGPDFDLVNILQSFKGMIKLPMEASICKRGTHEPDTVVILQGIREEWALCGIMTGEVGEKKGNVQFMYKAELPASLPYTAQKIEPRDPHSKTAMQLKAEYEKAVSVNGEADLNIYDVPTLSIYETVIMEMTSNPAYDSCYDGGAAAPSDSNIKHLPSSLFSGSVKRNESHPAVNVASNWQSASLDAEVICMKRAVTLPLPVVPAANLIHESGKTPPSSQVLRGAGTGSAPPNWSRTKVRVQMPVADTSFKEYSGQHVKRSESEVQSCATVSTCNRNVAFLKSLDIDMVQRLLTGMNLSEHRVRFQAEQVDGEILACCDAETLQELGVASRIQIIRLTKLIDGTHSASKFLKTD